MSWIDRLRGGLAKSGAKLTTNIGAIFGGGNITADTLAEFEDALIASDLGPAMAGRVVARLTAERIAGGVTEAAARRVLSDEITRVLAAVARPLEVHAFPRPQVVLVVGVNGSGKTTTIAKLGHLFQEQDYRVMLAAGDTFRAAAIEQLQVWGGRIGAPVVADRVGADAAGLAHRALTEAKAAGIDALLIDTAGRLQNKSGLMDELAKVKRVLAKITAAAPHDVVLVLDATTGLNALDQIEVFRDVAGVTGLVMTKLDGSARGGVLVAAAERFKLPIHAVGVGETLDDLRPFDARAFADTLAGVSR